MDEIKCKVIRDLLPLYEDNAASEETQELVRKHLKDCPACREELRKMRTPISLPPNEDEETVKRFLEDRAKIRKKQNVKIACVTSVLAVLFVFCLCYTLIPRSWDSISHDANPDRIMGVLDATSFYHGKASKDLWQLDDEQEQDTETISTLMDTLRTGSYRGDLRNVLNHTPLGGLFDTSVYGLRGMLMLALVKDNEVIATFYLYDTNDHIIHIRAGENPNTFFYHANDELYDALAALIKEYGVLK